MILAFSLALQAAGQPAPSDVMASDFDLARVRPAAPDPGRSDACRGGDASEIVVCGRREAGYRLKELPRTYEEGPLMAETPMAGGTARAYVEQVEMPGGQISKRAMVGVRWGF